MTQHIHILCHGNVVLQPPFPSIEPAMLSSLESVAPIVPAPRFSPLIHEPGRFLKLDENGIEMPAGATGHAIVRDQALNRDWLVAYPTDEAVPHAKAMEAAAAVTVGGFTNWRAPTLAEQFSIAQHDRYNPAIDTDLFPGAKSGWHWTSSPDASDPDYAWLVDFYYGGAYLYHRDDLGWVRAVRSVAPASAASQ